MLANFEKYHVFAKALAPVVPNQDVVDIGAGSGVLSLICLALGARSVLAIERPEVAQLTREVLDGFGVPPGIRVVAKDLFDTQDDEVAGRSVIVSETIGYLGFEENIAPLMAYAKRWRGMEKAILVPRSLGVTVAGIGLVPGLRRRRPFTSTSRYPIAALAPVGDIPGSFVLGEMPPATMSWQWSFQSEKSQILSGIVFSFTADLGCGHHISNNQQGSLEQGQPTASGMTWPRLVCPVSEPWVLQEAENLGVQLELNCDASRGGAYGCTIRCSAAGDRAVDIQAEAPGFCPDYYPCGRDVSGGVRSVLAGLGLLDHIPGLEKKSDELSD
jgi:hypothetical protein